MKNSFINPFTKDNIKQAVTLVNISKQTGSSSVFDTILRSLDRQYIMLANVKKKENERSALITCPVCDRSTISNYENYKQFYKEWYCKKCGQRLELPQK